MPVIVALLALASSAVVEPPRRPVAEVDTAPPWHLELELPLALLSRRSASGARGEVTPMVGARASLTRDLGAWILAGELGAWLGWPDRRDLGALAVQGHDAALDAALRFGRDLRARGFVLQPYLRATALAGLHAAWFAAATQQVTTLTPVFGAGLAAGLIAGHGPWCLRWDLGLLHSSRGDAALAAVGLGWRW